MPELRAIHTAELLRDIFERSPHRNALVHVERGVRYSYKEFTQAIDQLARGLLGLGIKKDTHVAIWATNLPEWAMTMFAIARIGGVLVSVDPSYQEDQVEYLLRQSDCQTLVFMKGSKGDEYLRILLKLAPDLQESEPGLLRTQRLPQLKNLILISEDTFPGVFLWKEVLGKGEDVPPRGLEERTRRCQADDIFTLLYTSGTTGPPKGVMSSHFALLNKSIASAEFQRLSEPDRLCLPIPLFHMFGCICVLLTAVACGATAAIPSDTFDPTMTLRAIEEEKCTALYGAPSLFISLLEHPHFDDFDLSSLRTGIIGGSPCPLEVMKQVVERMGVREITIGYGATEASSWITQTKTDDPLEARVSTIGRAHPNIEVKIIDPRSGDQVPDGVQGELCARGLLMKGYYQMPAATAEAIDQDGWLHTGDLAQKDSTGFFKITGRLKEVINKDGQEIYPVDIEEFLYTNSKIAEAQVCGVPDQEHGAEIAAWIKLKEGQTAHKEEIISFCQEGLDQFLVPKYMEFVRSFPLTPTGKVQKFKLQDKAIKLYNL